MTKKHTNGKANIKQLMVLRAVLGRSAHPCALPPFSLCCELNDAGNHLHCLAFLYVGTLCYASSSLLS